MIKILTFNTNGLGDDMKQREVFHCISKKGFDVIFLQETHSTKKQEKFWSSTWGSKIWFAHGESNARGVVIMFNKKLNVVIHNVIIDQGGRYNILYVMLEGIKMLLVNIYAPNQDNPQFFEDVAKEIDRFTPEHILMAGDFNLAIDPKIDRQGSYTNNDKAGKALLSIMNKKQLLDTWRYFHPEQNGFTWQKLRPKASFSRLDYILVSDTFEQYVDKVQLAPGFRSDHSMLSIIVSIQQHKRGPGYWKLNTSFLKDAEYLEKMNALIEIELSQNFSSFRTKWELLKLSAGGLTVQFTARKQKSKKMTLEVLERKLAVLHRQLENQTIFTDTENQIRLVKHEIENINKTSTQGAMVRARTQWETQAEMPTKYFLNLEKCNKQRKTLSRILNNQEVIVKDPKIILNEIKKFYEKLYTSKRSCDLDFLDSIIIPKISDEMKTEMENEISEKEVSEALLQLANNKSPSIDGIPPEWIKAFWPKLKHFMTELMREIARDGRMHLTARRGIISLLEKSWRPLTLLNADNKLYGKILANRLHKALNPLIHHSQTGFLKGRSLQENMLKLMEVINHREQNAQDGIIVSFDFMKAFDTIEWEAMFHLLVAYNLAQNF